MKISYSRLFTDDVNAIADYIEKQLYNPSSAMKIKSGIFAEVKRLADSPYLGEPLPPVFRINNQDLRKLVFVNYIIIYRVTDQIVAERVFYGRQDWMRLLNGTPCP